MGTTRALSFHPTRCLTTLDVEEVLATVEPLITRRVDRRGLGDGNGDDQAPDAWSDAALVLPGLAVASVQGTVALGPRRGARLRCLGQAREPVDAAAEGRCHARANGLDLHADLVVPAGQRARLERVCRYALRSPVAQERHHLTADGQVRLELRQPWRDGTTDIVFDPVDFLGRLAVLVPRPRINLLLYHGVLGARAAWRAEVIRHTTAAEGGTAALAPVTELVCEVAPEDTARSPARGRYWAALMQRSFGLDVLACPGCGGRLRLIALIAEAAVIGRLLRHLGVPAEIPAPRPARAPPPGAAAPNPVAWDAQPSVFTPCS